MLLSDASFVIVDVETTGLSAVNNRITEIGLVRLERGKITESYESLINPEQYISPFITQHTGITNAMVYNKPKFADVLPDIKSFFDKSGSPIFVGHNVKFDHGFVVESFNRVGQHFQPASPSDLLCTCRLARKLLPKLRSKSLANVQAYFGIKNARQHRALGDAEATAKILGQFIGMADELEIETLEDFLRLQFAKNNYSRRKSTRELSLREKVRTLPHRPGVYTMTSADGTVLYVGKSKNLHDRVGSYFSESNTAGTKLARMMRAVCDITYEETGSELSALLLESKKIKEFNPRFNSMDRLYKPQSFLRLSLDEAFPQLTFSREPAQDGGEYFGPFKSRDAAEALLEILNRAFKLRKCGEKFRIGLDVQPCIYRDIKLCDAPCALLQSKDEYAAEVKRLQEFLAAGDEGILAHVEDMMTSAADRLDFEEAQFFKVRLLELKRVLGSGERPSASISSNDFVILNPLVGEASACQECEIYFVRFGQLMKQMVLGAGHIAIAEQWFARQLRLYYGPTSSIPTTAGRPEIDEMRILTRWVEQKREKGSRIVYIEENWERSVTKLVGELRSIFGGNAPIEESQSLPNTNSAKREKRLKLKPMKA